MSPANALPKATKSGVAVKNGLFNNYEHGITMNLQFPGGARGRNPSRDLWLLNNATKTTRQLTHFTDQNAMRSFDLTPDGRQIVFDRSRENSDIVLMDLPR